MARVYNIRQDMWGWVIDSSDLWGVVEATRAGGVLYGASNLVVYRPGVGSLETYVYRSKVEQDEDYPKHDHNPVPVGAS